MDHGTDLALRLRCCILQRSKHSRKEHLVERRNRVNSIRRISLLRRNDDRRHRLVSNALAARPETEVINVTPLLQYLFDGTRRQTSTETSLPVVCEVFVFFLRIYKWYESANDE